MSVTVTEPPEPQEVTEFRFRGLRRLRLDGAAPLPGRALLAVAARAGLVLVGGNNCVRLVRTADIEAQNACSKVWELFPIFVLQNE